MKNQKSFISKERKGTPTGWWPLNREEAEWHRQQAPASTVIIIRSSSRFPIEEDNRESLFLCSSSNTRLVTRRRRWFREGILSPELVHFGLNLTTFFFSFYILKWKGSNTEKQRISCNRSYLQLQVLGTIKASSSAKNKNKKKLFQLCVLIIDNPEPQIFPFQVSSIIFHNSFWIVSLDFGHMWILHPTFRCTKKNTILGGQKFTKRCGMIRLWVRIMVW